MNLEFFPHFFRKNYPKVEATNEEIEEIGTEFKKYLEKKFDGQMQKLEKVWDIDAKTVIMNQVNKNPFTTNGYHPALIIHFSDFVEKMKNETQETICYTKK